METLEQEFKRIAFEHKCKIIGYGFMSTVVAELTERGRENEIEERAKDVPQFVLNTIIPDLIEKGKFENAYNEIWESIAECLP